MELIFKKLDKNKDGVLNKNELQNLSEDLGVPLGFVHDSWDKIFKNLDLDGDGNIDFHEFMAAANKHHKILTKKNIRDLFDTFDMNGDGVIDITEFKAALPTNHRSTM